LRIVIAYIKRIYPWIGLKPIALFCHFNYIKVIIRGSAGIVNNEIITIEAVIIL
jgi:hypothetical protein